MVDAAAVVDLYTLAPCGHRRLCSECATRLMATTAAERRCPVCCDRVLCVVRRVYDDGDD